MREEREGGEGRGGMREGMRERDEGGGMREAAAYDLVQYALKIGPIIWHPEFEVQEVGLEEERKEGGKRRK
jgi:hypothetical protein